MSESLVVVVTGCSKDGIGAATCEAFFQRGHRVFAASRSLGTMETLSIGIERIELDVNSEESIGLGIEKIVARAGRIDILVNNAGQGCIGALVEVSMQKMRDTFDVNVFGLMGMIQKVSPVMIAQRNGLIINIGSMVSIVPTPWAGVYCASKAAVSSFSDTLRMEVQGFNIKVMIVAPGAIISGIGAANAKRGKTSLDVASPYKSVEQHIQARGSWSQSPQSTPTHELATAIVNAALSGSPPRTLMFGHRSTIAYYSYYLPGFIRDRVFGWFGTDQVGREVV